MENLSSCTAMICLGYDETPSTQHGLRGTEEYHLAVCKDSEPNENTKGLRGTDRKRTVPPVEIVGSRLEGRFDNF
jgi:hypothetical protein